jgi:ABC-type multidrug transport system ATPase subunit
MNPTLASIHTEVAEDRLDRAVTLLLDLARDEGDTDQVEAALVLAGRWAGLERGARLGTSLPDERPKFILDLLRTASAAAAPPSALQPEVKVEVTRPGPVLVLHEVTKRYGALTALDRLTLEVRPGEIVGILGGNASGKTTALRIAAGVLAPTAGTAHWIGFSEPIPDPGSPGSGLAYVPQTLDPWPEPVQDTLELVAAWAGLKGPTADRRIAWWVHRLGLGPHVERRWQALSGGYRLRSALAAALLTEPRLLVLDEPLAALDLASVQTVLADLRSLVASARHPLAIVLSSHHVHDVEAVADRLVLLDGGIPRAFVPGSLRTGERTRRFEVAGPRSAADWSTFARVLGAGVERRLVTGAVLVGSDELDAAAIADLAERWGLPLAWIRELTGTAAGALLEIGQPPSGSLK